jgi:hypothetical protein
MSNSTPRPVVRPPCLRLPSPPFGRQLHRDLVIAAHAAETGRTVVSKDAKARFNDLPGVAAITA